ncbi:DUF2863 family protein [Candidatus Vallotia tarda]|uniref:DUF2863 family protein n=1 Tax=Candidatus Vallotiella hemipterorum TaxID=1177213 RepID=A0A916JSZ0_9BURK|nr:DUF2863 family protein [Candidatus Vallotia tarda]CAG7601233.1 Putative uncharacterized protein [Candidatus Vallotia tarda]
MRSRIDKHLSPDADKLIDLSLALFASGSRIEDRFWEVKLDELIKKVIRNRNQTTLDVALDYLRKKHSDVYGTLADLAETHSESTYMDHDGQSYCILLIAAPVLTWTRYMIPSGPLKNNIVNALRAQLQEHVFAMRARSALAPYLYSIDQLPRHHAETFQLVQKLGQAALFGCEINLKPNDPQETSLILADPRFLISVVATPAGEPLFRWQEEDSSSVRIKRGQCLEKWRAQGRANFPGILPGCEFDCLLPDAYYSACRHADEKIRPHTIRSAVRYLGDTIIAKPDKLRAVIAGFGERQVDEYRIAFTRRGNNDVIYGVVWPLYGRETSDFNSENEVPSIEDPAIGILDKIVGLLKDIGVTDIRRHAACFEPEYCDDCGVPLYANPLGEIVHAEMPEDAEETQPHFH